MAIMRAWEPRFSNLSALDTRFPLGPYAGGAFCNMPLPHTGHTPSCKGSDPRSRVKQHGTGSLPSQRTPLRYNMVNRL
jgi:hypothetical protein